MNIHRHKIERAIDVLIALLDAADGDPDLEPSLGYNPYGSNDAEGEHDGREPDEDGEPDLGWTENVMQGGPSWFPIGWGVDHEADPAESGIADWLGIDEQMGRAVA